MKMFLMSLVVAGVSHWASVALCCPDDDGDAVKQKVVRVVGQADGIVVADPSSDQAHVVRFISDDGKSNAEFVVSGDEPNNLFVVKAGANDGRSEDQRIVVRRVGDEDHGGWLGVSIAEVPDALAAQLDIEGLGVLIQNVVEGSPADKAGLKMHDILLEVNGEEVDGDIGRAVNLVKDNKAGDTIDVVVLRDGEERTIEVELGSRSDLTGMKMDWKFEFAPDAEVEDHVQARGKMMWRDDDGNWAIKDLGDLSELKNLPESIKMFVPKGGERTVEFFNEDGQHRVRTEVQQNGNVIVVEQDGDEITVTRVIDGEESKTTYESMDELKDGDEEAYEMLQDAKGPIGVQVDVHGLADIDLDGLEGLNDWHDLKIDIPKFEFKFDDKDWKEHFQDWHDNLDKSLEAAKDAHAKAMKEFQELMEDWKVDKSGTFKKMAPNFIWKSDEGDGGKAYSFFSKAKHTFQVKPDGKIEVRIRKGDSELVLVFDDENDMMNSHPDLYQKYEELLSAEDEE